MSDRRRGAVFTPEHIARGLAVAALDTQPAPRSVCDPAAGDGRLLDAVDALTNGASALFGADVDGAAWRGRAADRRTDISFVVADALGRGLDLWPDAPSAGFDLVIGNPPFLSQVGLATARTADERARVRRSLGGTVGGLADTATVFLVAACEMLAPGGQVAMIMPLSFLSNRDATGARRRVLELCHLTGIWVSAGHVFPGADVEVCALLLERGDVEPHEVRRWSGEEWAPAAPRPVPLASLRDGAPWSDLVADLLGDVPEMDLATGHGRLGDLATATAGFRDQFYGLAPHVREVAGPSSGRVDGFAPLMTSGAIDPGSVAWSHVAARVAGHRRLRPAIDPSDLDAGSALARWVEARRVPKVLVATQTRVIEGVADPTGEWIPSTPVLSVECDPADLWRVLAVVLAPPATVWARRRYAGAARSTRALKLSARQILDLPLPPEGTLWADAAGLLERHHDPSRGGVARGAVCEAAVAMTAAYGGPDVFAWWSDQLPAPRGEGELP